MKFTLLHILCEGQTEERFVKSGASVTSRIGIEALLENCTHFREWVELIKNKCTDD